MPNRFPRFTAVLLLLFSALPGIGQTTPRAQSTPPAPSYSARRPRLVVVISIDQFRYEYLKRFAPWFSAGGFNRFLKQGADFDHAFYRHAITFTGPGHAAIGTGRNPAETGIVGNTWLERNAPFDQRAWDWFFEDTGGYKAASHPVAAAGMPAWYAHGGTPRYCVDDPRTRVSEGRTDGMSPVALDGDSLGDRLKQKYPDAHVVATALKDRAAILMAGRRADAAYWFDHKLPGFVSSGYYRYDRSLLDFNSRVKSYFPESGLWKLSGIIPTADMQRITFDPPAAWLLKNPLYGGTFDHPVKSGRAFAYSPFANDMLLDFTSAAIEHHHLGEDSSPDLLFIGISTPDYIGHYYGPDSMEVADDAVRLDRSLERFLNALVAKIGDGLLVAITADHGVQSRPEIARLRDPKIDAGRTDLRNAIGTAHFISELPPLRIELERLVAKKLEIPFNADAPLSQALLFFFEEPSLYLNWDRISELTGGV
ncbi:MAG: alkaline phosphatase family protein [Acidobacteriota bacterium]